MILQVYIICNLKIWLIMLRNYVYFRILDLHIALGLQHFDAVIHWYHVASKAAVLFSLIASGSLQSDANNSFTCNPCQTLRASSFHLVCSGAKSQMEQIITQNLTSYKLAWSLSCFRTKINLFPFPKQDKISWFCFLGWFYYFFIWMKCGVSHLVVQSLILDSCFNNSGPHQWYQYHSIDPCYHFALLA